MIKRLLLIGIPFAILISAEPLLRLHWMYLGLGGALFLAIAFVANPAAWNGRRSPLALLFAYLLHQFEEHGVDALGNVYAFQASANGLLGPVLGCGSGGECPLTVDAIFWANTLLVWWPYTLALAFGVERRALLLGVAGLTLANALAHVLPAVATGSYNPGLVSALVLFLPVGVTVLWQAHQAWGASRGAMALGFLWGALAHPLLALAAFAVYERGVAPPWLYPTILFAYACLPLLIRQRFVLRSDASSLGDERATPQGKT